MLESGVSLAGHVWSFAPRTPLGREAGAWPVTTSPAAVALSKDLKKRGWRFVGPTTVYSFMQSMGLVNDHFDGCHALGACESAREAVLNRGG
jgi:DNA-3-methyladenine glycosylase I